MCSSAARTSSNPNTRSITGLSLFTPIARFIPSNISRDPTKIPCSETLFISTAIGLKAPSVSTPINPTFPPPPPPAPALLRDPPPPPPHPRRRHRLVESPRPPDLHHVIHPRAPGDLQHFLLPIGRLPIVNHLIRPHLPHARQLRVLTRRRDHPRARRLRELQRENRNPTR